MGNADCATVLDIASVRYDSGERCSTHRFAAGPFRFVSLRCKAHVRMYGELWILRTREAIRTNTTNVSSLLGDTSFNVISRAEISSFAAAPERSAGVRIVSVYQQCRGQPRER